MRHYFIKIDDNGTRYRFMRMIEKRFKGIDICLNIVDDVTIKTDAKTMGLIRKEFELKKFGRTNGRYELTKDLAA